MDNTRYLIDGPKGGARIVLAHGAGAPMDSEWMNEFAAGLGARGLSVIRFEFPYMQKRRADGRRRGPDRAPTLLSSWRDVIDDLGDAGSLVIGGKSMGGRIASMVADECGVGGLVCLGYPFHPPGRPEKLRTAHLETIETPTLIVQGTRDRFGTADEVPEFGLASQIELHWLGDGDHSFKPRVKSGRTLQQNLDEALDAVTAFVESL